MQFDDSRRWDAAILIARVWLGAMMITHGWGKVFGGVPRLTKSVTEMGFPLPEFFAWCAALTEFGGGIMLILGLLTRPMSAFVIVVMGVAAFVRHADDPFGRQELPLTYLVMALTLLIVGAGRYSIDYVLPGGRLSRERASVAR
jgi:putative oxidoreductase